MSRCGSPTRTTISPFWQMPWTGKRHGRGQGLARRFLLPLMAHNPSCKYVLASDCVDDARACKDAVERDLMREASRINDVVMERLPPT